MVGKNVSSHRMIVQVEMLKDLLTIAESGNEVVD